MSARIDRAGSNGAGFSNSEGHFCDVDKVTLADAATLTATANGTGLPLGDRGTLCLTLTVSAHTAGGDTLDVSVQTSADNGVSDTWRTLGSFTQSTDVGSERKSFSGADRWVRYRAVLAGAGVSTTFTISGDAK